MANDPVCGKHVDEASAQFTSEHEGKTYYFCCSGCLRHFEENPIKYRGEHGSEGAHMGGDH